MTAKQRTCLRCGKSFDSAGPDNRICKQCTRVNNCISVSRLLLQWQHGVKRHNGKIISDPVYVELIKRVAKS